MAAEPHRMLFITHNFPPILGGISVFSWEICKALSNLDLDIKVITCAEPISNMNEKFSVLNVKEKKIFSKARRLAIYLPFKKTILDWKPDIIFLASLHPYGLFVSVLAQRYRIPYIVGTHGSEIWRLSNARTISPLESWMGKTTLRKASIIFCVSHYLASVVKAVVPEAVKPVVIPNGVDCSVFTLAPGDIKLWSKRSNIDLSDKFVLLSISSLIAHKGHSVVIKAVNKLRNIMPNTVYLIAGEGENLPNLESLVTDLSLVNHVRFLGPIPREEIPSLLRTAQLLILNSQPQPGEGFGIVILEANACGLPVIAGRTGGIPDAVVDGVTGLLVDPENPDEIADSIARIGGDEILRRRMAWEGRRWAEQHDWSLLAPRYLEALKHLLK